MLTPYIDWLMGGLGGLLIGLATLLLMGLNGRIAGISGIAGGLVEARREGFGWRAMFVIGLIAGPFLFQLFNNGQPATIRIEDHWPTLIAGGLLVGFGSRLGSGCTSGHGVCGLARMSGRSLVAVPVFFVCALVTVFVIRHMAGG